jgi:hypothetical protein
VTAGSALEYEDEGEDEDEDEESNEAGPGAAEIGIIET